MSDSSILCPLCGEGRLLEHSQERQYKNEDHAYVVTDLRYSLCSHCGEEITTPEQSRHNKRIIIAARDQAVAERDRLERLTPDDILSIRKRLQLTQVQAARVFGGGPNAFGKYECGEVAPSDGMDKLLRLADKVPEAAVWLLRRAGLTAPPMLQNACSRMDDCTIIRRLKESWTAGFPEKNQLANQPALLASLAGYRPAQAAQSFTFEAANDSGAYLEPDLAA